MSGGLVDDTEPDLDPADTLSSWVLCRFLRYGCAYGIRYQPGQYVWARSDMDRHEFTCLYRFGPDPN